MKALNNWDKYKQAQAQPSNNSGNGGNGGGSRNYTSPGPDVYICQIVDCVEQRYEKGSCLAVDLDILSGEFRGFYTKRHERHPDWRWGCTLRVWIPTEEDLEQNSVRAQTFNRFINNVERSNQGYKWDFMESGLIGKQIGCVFQEQEYDFINQEGQEIQGMHVVPARAYSVQYVQEGRAKLLPPRYINRGQDDAQNVQAPQNQQFTPVGNAPAGFQNSNVTPNINQGVTPMGNQNNNFGQAPQGGYGQNQGGYSQNPAPQAPPSSNFGGNPQGQNNFGGQADNSNDFSEIEEDDDLPF